MLYGKGTLELNLACNEVEQELADALNKYPKLNSLHEAYAVLQEEVDEFWDEVKAKPAVRAERKVQIRKELIQIAAMAVRTIVDCID